MKKRILGSLITMGLAATLVGGATFAYFSDTATNSNNTFKTGTLDISAGAQTYSVPIDNIKPGDQISGSFTVTNDGTLPLNFTVAKSATGALFTGDVNGDGNVEDLNFANVTIDTNQAGSLDVAASKTVTYTIDFPNASVSQDDLKNATGTLSFQVDARNQ